MNIGKLDQRVTLQSPVQVRDAMGQMTLSWADAATVWAERVPLSAREIVAAQGIAVERTAKFRIRFRADVTERWRLVWDGKGHDIQGVQPFGGRADRLELTCVEGIKDGR